MEKSKIKIAILSIASLVMISLTASAILAEIQMHFTEVSQTFISMILTIPPLLGVIFAFIAGPLSMKISKKNIIIFGLTCGLVGGSVSFLLGPVNFYILLFCSVLIGIAQGITSTMTMALIADYFSGDERGALMGLQSAFLNGGSMVLLFTAGLLANIQWNYSYIVYLAFIPVIVINLRNLPNDKPQSLNDGKNDQKKQKLNSRVFFTGFILFSFGVFLFVFHTNIALFIASEGLGSASTSGMVNASLPAAGMIAGILFGRVQKRLKTLTIPTALGITGIGMILVYAIGNLPALFLAAMCCGFGMATIMPSGTFIAANAVAPALSAMAIAIVTGAFNLGMFVSPFISNILVNLIGSENIASKFLMAGVGLLIIAVIAVMGDRLIARRSI